MKKSLVGLGLLVGVTFSGFTTTTHVDASEIKFYEEKSIEEAYQDAINGISDINLDHINISSNEMTAVPSKSNLNTKNGLSLDSNEPEDLEITEYKTAQVLQESEDEQSIVVTVFNDVEISDEGQLAIASITPLSGDKGGNKTDDSASVRSHSRIYFKTKIENNITYATLTKVTGGWTILDSSVSLSNRKVVNGITGWPGVAKSSTLNPSTNTYNSSFSWPYVATSTTYHLGTNATVTLKRGSSTWTLYHQNNAAAL
jgi:hypothetical protein